MRCCTANLADYQSQTGKNALFLPGYDDVPSGLVASGTECGLPLAAVVQMMPRVLSDRTCGRDARPAGRATAAKSRLMYAAFAVLIDHLQRRRQKKES